MLSPGNKLVLESFVNPGPGDDVILGPLITNKTGIQCLAPLNQSQFEVSVYVVLELQHFIIRSITDVNHRQRLEGRRTHMFVNFPGDVSQSSITRTNTM